MVKRQRCRLYQNKNLTKGRGFSWGGCIPQKDTGGKPMKNESPEQCPKRITEEPEDEGVKAILAEGAGGWRKEIKCGLSAGPGELPQVPAVGAAGWAH